MLSGCVCTSYGIDFYDDFENMCVPLMCVCEMLPGKTMKSNVIKVELAQRQATSFGVRGRGRGEFWCSAVMWLYACVSIICSVLMPLIFYLCVCVDCI